MFRYVIRFLIIAAVLTAWITSWIYVPTVRTYMFWYILRTFDIITILIGGTALLIYVPKKIYSLKYFDCVRNRKFLDIAMKILYSVVAVFMSYICLMLVLMLVMVFQVRKDVSVQYKDHDSCFRLINRIDDAYIDLFMHQKCSVDIKFEDGSTTFFRADRIRNIFVENNTLNIVLPKNTKYSRDKQDLLPIEPDYFKVVDSDTYGVEYVRVRYAK